MNRPECIALLIIVCGGVILDLAGFFTSPEAVLAHTALSIATTLTFSLYIWSPLVATSALGIAVALSFFIGNAAAGISAAAVAALLVLRLGAIPLIAAYTAGLLLTIALFIFRYEADELTPSSVAASLTVATVAGGVGLALRAAYARGHRLEHELAEQAEREREAVLAERRWIAGELHDSIAHHLTIVALHV